MPPLFKRSTKSALDKRHLVSPVLQARRRLGYTIAIGVVLCAITYFFYTSPKTSAESTSNANLIAERQLVATAVANLKGTVSGTTNACTEYRQDHALDQLLPASQPDVTYGALSNLVQGSGLVVSSIAAPSTAPVGTTSGALYIAYSISATGTYPQLRTAINDINAYSPLLTVSAVNMTASATVVGAIAATVTIDEWWYPTLAVLPTVNSATCK
jgi:Tfp pilus assembly protein PilO